jgi:hypothetical protein
VYNYRSNTHSYQNKKTAELYKIVRGNRYKNLPIDHDKLLKQWLHPAARFMATGDTDDQTPINIYTDGRKSERGVGAGIVIKRPGTPNITLMYRMNNSCSNNQAEAFAILKALEYVKSTQTQEEDKAITLHTDGTTTLESLIYTDQHTFLNDEIRQLVHDLEI